MQKLMDEIDKLRQQQSQQGSASNSSWIEVGGDSTAMERGFN